MTKEMEKVVNGGKAEVVADHVTGFDSRIDSCQSTSDDSEMHLVEVKEEEEEEEEDGSTSGERISNGRRSCKQRTTATTTTTTTSSNGSTELRWQPGGCAEASGHFASGADMSTELTRDPNIRSSRQSRLTKDDPRHDTHDKQSTQCNGQEYTNSVDAILIRCAIERPKSEEEEQEEAVTSSPEVTEKEEEEEGRPLVLDVVTAVPGSTLFRDLIETVLTRNGFNWIDIVGARGFLLPSCAWRPISMETVTKNRLATVRDVISGLEKSLVLRIVLQKSIIKKNFSNETRLKDLLLKRLISVIPDEVFESLRCPVDKGLLENLRRSDPIEDNPEELMVDSLNGRSVCQPRSSRPQRSNDDVILADDRRNGREEISKRGSGGNSVSDSEKSKFSALEEPFLRNPRPELTGCTEELNGERSTQNDPVFTMGRLVDWFCSAAAATRPGADLSGGAASKTGSLDGDSSNFDRKRRKVEAGMESLPLLPNRNAVYLVQPLPPDANNDLENAEPERSVSSSSMSSSFRDEVLAEPLLEKGGQDHHGIPGPLPDQATDLSLTSRTKNESNKSPFDWKALATSWPHHHHQHPSLLWPARNFGADPEILSESPSPKGLLPDPLHNLYPSPACPSSSASMPFLYPHYPLARMPPLAPNAIQLAAMSQLFRHTAAAAFYGSVPVFSPAAIGGCEAGDDQGSSPGSNPGDSERRKRSRVFIDPNTEIPRLEEWYRADTHPSAVQIERYTGELNAAEYRRRFPRLETKNVQLWFKNHRAKVKRLTLDEEDSNGSGCCKVIASDGEEAPLPRQKTAYSTA